MYIFIHVPAQEIFIRAYLQGPLQRFLSEKYAALKAIIISNVLFATFHTILSVFLSVFAFLNGLLWGWLYYRQRSIVGPILSHILLGVWGLYVLGMPALR